METVGITGYILGVLSLSLSLPACGRKAPPAVRRSHVIGGNLRVAPLKRI